MQTITLREKVGDDGILRLAIPVEPRGEEIEVVVVYQNNGDGAPKNGNSQDWIDRTYGSCVSEPLERPDQGTWETREEIA